MLVKYENVITLLGVSEEKSTPSQVSDQRWNLNYEVQVVVSCSERSHTKTMYGLSVEFYWLHLRD
jgi:hypothetical protein